MPSGILRFEGSRWIIPPIHPSDTLFVFLRMISHGPALPFSSYIDKALVQLQLRKDMARILPQNIEGTLGAGALTVLSFTVSGRYVATNLPDFIASGQPIPFNGPTMLPGLTALSGQHVTHPNRKNLVKYTLEIEWTVPQPGGPKIKASSLDAMHKPSVNDVVFVFPAETAPERQFLWGNCQQLAADSEYFQSLLRSQGFRQPVNHLPSVQDWQAAVDAGLRRVLAESRTGADPATATGTIAIDANTATIRYIVVRDHSYDTYKAILEWFLTGKLADVRGFNRAIALYNAADYLLVVPLRDTALTYLKVFACTSQSLTKLMELGARSDTPLSKLLLGNVRNKWDYLLQDNAVETLKNSVNAAETREEVQELGHTLLAIIQPAAQPAAPAVPATATPA